MISKVFFSSLTQRGGPLDRCSSVLFVLGANQVQVLIGNLSNNCRNIQLSGNKSPPTKLGCLSNKCCAVVGQHGKGIAC